ncbi:MAG: hypothetical protein GY851_34900 [bacterium]|nr:hypothetical protein [bacterium]
MSSILDALRKVERDKAAHVAAAEGDLDDATAEHELIGRHAPGRGMTIRLTPVTLAAGGLALVGVLIVVSVGVSFVVARTAAGPGPQLAGNGQSPTPPPEPTAPPAPIAESRPQEVAPPPVLEDPSPNLPGEPLSTESSPLEIPADPGPTAPLPTTPKPTETVEQPSLDNVAPVPVETVEQSGPDDVKPVSEKQPVETTALPGPKPDATLETKPAEQAAEHPVNTAPAPVRPVPVPVEATVESAHAPTTPPPEPVQLAKIDEPVVATSTDPKPAATTTTPKPKVDTPAEPVKRVEPDKPLNVTQLPFLTERIRIDLGLPPISVNLTGSVRSAVRPWALINYKKVYVGDCIPRTDAILLGVDVKGVGIEVQGKRYFVTK